MLKVVKMIKKHEHFVQTIFKKFYLEMSTSTNLGSQKSRKLLECPFQARASSPLAQIWKSLNLSSSL